MKCPKCDDLESRVLDTRVQKDGEIRRRRECLSCKHRFTTMEILVTNYPHIVKKDGRREPYSREKLKKGIQIACKKRPISIAAIDNIVTRISQWVQTASEKELHAKELGQAVIDELRKLDDVAYVRFASVYKHFHDINEFVKTLEKEPRKGHQ
jgi:transcriptional repressor NrdR